MDGYPHDFICHNSVTVDRMGSSLATVGLPGVLVTDNGTPFTSAKFEHFCALNGI